MDRSNQRFFSSKSNFNLLIESDWAECPSERLGGLFIFTTFEHVSNGKPEPDVFIEAARRLDTDPAQCLVIEDSAGGWTN